VSGQPATPGQAAYEAHAAMVVPRPWRWDQLDDKLRAAWEAAAQAAIAVASEPDDYEPGSVVIGPGERVIADFPVADAAELVRVTAERDALLARLGPASEGRGLTAQDVVRGLLDDVTEARAQLADAAAENAELTAQLALDMDNWPKCPDDCGCRLGLGDADRQECGCTGPCTMECRENGYPDAKSYRDLAVERLTAERDKVYRERAALVAFLAACYPAAIGIDPVEPGWPVAYVTTPAGQMAWHISQDDLELFPHVPRQPETAITWDGHTTEVKYERLAEFTRMAATLPAGIPLRLARCPEHPGDVHAQLGSAGEWACLRGLADVAEANDALTVCRRNNAAIAAQLDQYRGERDKQAADWDRASVTYHEGLARIASERDGLRELALEILSTYTGDTERGRLKSLASPGQHDHWRQRARAGLDAPDRAEGGVMDTAP